MLSSAFEAATSLSLVKQRFPDFFRSKTVLDVGGGDINGNNSHLFIDCL